MGKKKDNIVDFAAYTERNKGKLFRGTQESIDMKWVSADECMEMATMAPNQEDAIFYMNKALEKDKNNVEALLMQIMIAGESYVEVESSVKKLIKKEGARLKRMDCFDEWEGDYWAVWETRPYMRLRFEFVNMLRDQGKLKLAALECKEMLRLCEGDNIGARYVLVGIYAALEDDVEALKLYEVYKDDCSASMLLPLMLLFYKLGNVRKAESFLRKLVKTNTEIDVFLDEWMDETGFLDVSRLQDAMGAIDMYELGSAEEIVATILSDLKLYVSCPSFFEWFEERYDAL